MGASESELQLAKLLEKHEAAVSGLYRAYARCFPGDEAAWRELADAELVHAGWLRGLQPALADGTLRFPGAQRLLPDIVQASLDYVAAQATSARESEVVRAEAIEAAIGIEETMLEGDWFALFEGDSPEVREVLEHLTRDTQQHLSSLQALAKTEGLTDLEL